MDVREKDGAIVVSVIRYFKEKKFFLVITFILLLVLWFIPFSFIPSPVAWNFRATLVGIALTVGILDFLASYDNYKRQRSLLTYAEAEIAQILADTGLAFCYFDPKDNGLVCTFYEYRALIEAKQDPTVSTFDYYISERNECYGRAKEYARARLDRVQIQKDNWEQPNFRLLYSTAFELVGIELRVQNAITRYKELFQPEAIQLIYEMRDALTALVRSLQASPYKEELEAESDLPPRIDLIELQEKIYLSAVQKTPKRFIDALIHLFKTVKNLLKLLEEGKLFTLPR